MNITILVNGTDDIFHLELPKNAVILDLFSEIERYVLMPLNAMSFSNEDNQPLIFTDENQSLTDLGLYDGIILYLSDSRFLPLTPIEEHILTQNIPFERILQISLSRPIVFCEYLRIFPEYKSQIQPEGRVAVDLGPRAWVDFLESDYHRLPIVHRRKFYTRMQTEGQANDDLEQVNKATSLLEQLVVEEQIEEAYHYAMEHTPEAFIPVNMLFIPMEVNGLLVAAFVDSGAQATIMSSNFARKCGLMPLIDTKYKGMAKGVGESKIFGRIHASKVKIGNEYLICSFTVVESIEYDILLGLDQLKRHLMSIDLRRHALVINDHSIHFLSDAEISKMNAARTEGKVYTPPFETADGMVESSISDELVSSVSKNTQSNLTSSPIPNDLVFSKNELDTLGEALLTLRCYSQLTTSSSSDVDSLLDRLVNLHK